MRVYRQALALVLLLASAAMTACDGVTPEVSNVESPPMGGAASEEVAGVSESGLRSGGEGTESILEFGLFGPVLPDVGAEGYETDCGFENAPFETCL
jgi:hypothetical protein